MRRRRIELLVAALLLFGVAPGIVAYQTGVFETTAPSCSDPCYVMGDRYDSGTQRWVLYLAHCPVRPGASQPRIEDCEPDAAYDVTKATWGAYRPGMRYAGPISP